jgi:hypothetical protein
MINDDTFHQYIVMQGFQPSSDIIAAAEHGEEVDEGAVLQLAEEQHQQRPQHQQPAPHLHQLNYITQAAPDSSADDDDDRSADDKEEDDQGGAQGGEDNSQDPAVEPSATAATASNSGEDTHSASLFTLFLASLNVQRDVPNRPSFAADSLEHSNAAALAIGPPTADTEAAANPSEVDEAARLQQGHQQGEVSQPAASATTSSRGTLVQHLQQAPRTVPNIHFHRHQQAAQSNNLPMSEYTYENLFGSNGMLFPMPTNSVYNSLYEAIIQATPSAFQGELRELLYQIDPIVTLGFVPDSSILANWDAGCELAVDPESVQKFRPVLKYLAGVLKKDKREQKKKQRGLGGGGGGGDDHGGDDDGYDDDDDDDDYDDIPDDKDGNDPADDGSQPELFDRLRKEREKRQSKRTAHQQYRLANIVLDYLLHYVSKQGVLLRQAHLIARNNARSMNEALAQMDDGKKINVSPPLFPNDFSSYSQS